MEPRWRSPGPLPPARRRSAIDAGNVVFVVEGERDVETLAALGITATTNAGGAGKWEAAYSEGLRGADVVIIPDNDKAGRDHAEAVAKSLSGTAKRVRLLDLAEHWSACPDKADVSDWLRDGGDAGKLRALVDALPDWKPQPKSAADYEWPDPRPLPSGLLPVDKYDSQFMPAALAPWADDIANRLQCPPDYVAVAAITALGAVIGRRVGIKPQQKTDWIEVPNIWGMFVGRPGMLKSPAMGEALRPIHHLEAEAAKENEVAQQAYASGLDAYKLRKAVRDSLEKDALKKGGSAKVTVDLGDEPEEPVPVRYRTNDASYESLGEILIGNPTGVLVERDELVSLLSHLDREDQSVARGFYLTGWSGTQPYTFDRIVRGHRHIEGACISVLGTTQPARIAEYVSRANRGGAGGDGLLQRFGLMVWPDAASDWKNIDEYPNSAARNTAWDVFTRAAALDEMEAIGVGAEKGPFDKVPFLRFDDYAAEDFLTWRNDLEIRVRSTELSPALEGHLAKHRKLVPGLALINHLADGGTGPVSQKALVRAVAFAHFLKATPAVFTRPALRASGQPPGPSSPKSAVVTSKTASPRGTSIGGTGHI
jgi:5S rRNA maturation endonuclease (ribonuclease M5)